MVMDTGFTRELAARKGISEQSAYCYINSLMDTIRQILAEGDEVRIGGFGWFTTYYALWTDLLIFAALHFLAAGLRFLRHRSFWHTVSEI